MPGGSFQPTSSHWREEPGVSNANSHDRSSPFDRYVEYLTPAPYIEEIVTEPFRLDEDGLLTIPERPGLGIELDRDALKRFSG
ncbi:MAG: hypothetical protein ABIP48_11550 [Planctomycetota bacterium]